MSKDENLRQYRKALADAVRAANWLSIPEKMAELSSLLEAMADELERNQREGFGDETGSDFFSSYGTYKPY